MKLKMIALFVVIGLVIIIMLQNTQVVSLQFLFWKISMSRIILLPLVLLVGFIIGFFTGRKSQH
ncbi:MAG: lipopolysaccharide assembly protein LapA domain-containing protein [Candidatus Omnitrophota bacterium]